MKTKYFIKSLLVPLVGLVGCALVLPAQADFSWTIAAPSAGSCTNETTAGNSCSQSSTDNGTTIVMTATAWASSSSVNPATSALEQATLKRWDGLGVHSAGEDSGAPQHAADANGKYESILYSFTSGGSAIQVALDSVKQGWHQDADFSLLRYTGAVAPVLAGNSYTGLLALGWELVSNNFYSGGASNDTDITASNGTPNSSANQYSNELNAAELSSSYWLVSVLNGAYWNGSSSYIGNDYIKVKTLTASALPRDEHNVPEPSSLALALLALGGLLVTRRKRATTASSLVA